MITKRLFLLLLFLISCKVFLGTSQTYHSDKLPDVSICGLRRANLTEGFPLTSRIVGGDPAIIGEFPWMAALEYRKRAKGDGVGVQCGGSLINNRYVLTAAHCLTDSIVEVFQVRLGELNLLEDPDCPDAYCKTEKIKVASPNGLIPHPYYDAKIKNNDIGLIRLERDVEYTEIIRPICLTFMDSPIVDNGMLEVAGWGFNEDNDTSEILLKAKVPFVNAIECKRIIENKNQMIRLNHICAGGDGPDTCRGDSGGPLMREIASSNGQLQWFQEGLVAWGYKCGIRDVPAVYTKVRRYVHWIEAQLE